MKDFNPSIDLQANGTGLVSDFVAPIEFQKLQSCRSFITRRSSWDLNAANYSNDWIDRIRWSAWSGNCERNTDLRFRDLVAVSRIERRSSLATSRMRHFSHLWTPQGLTHALWIANEKCHVLKWEEMKFTRLEPSLKSKITQNRNRGDWSSRVKMQKKRKI